MKAAVMQGINKGIIVEDLPDPVPAGDEIVIEQKQTGVCYRDILTYTGFFPRAKFPIVPGHEISGKIIATGPNVRNFKVGDRVATLIYIPCGICKFCLTGRENLCPNKKTMGENLQGSYAKYVKVPERIAVPVPASVPEEMATITACVTAMVYHAISVVGGCRTGTRILITGASGGVGSNAIQIAHALGCEVFAYTSSADKKEAIYSFGADYVLTGENFDRDVKNISGDGVDIVLEAVGMPTFLKSFRSLAFGGRMIVVGNIEPKNAELPIGAMILKGNRIEGSISSTRYDMVSTLRLAERGKIKHIGTAHFGLSEIEKAYSFIRSKNHTGRVFIDV